MEGLSTATRVAGRKCARAGAVKVAVALLLLVAPHIPSTSALKLASISEDRGHLGLGLLRAMEIVRGRYERAWSLVSAAEPSADDLDTALELLQANAKQWESLEPAVKLWTEREAEGADDVVDQPSSTAASPSRSKRTEEDHRHRQNHGNSPFPSLLLSTSLAGSTQGIPGEIDTTLRIYEEAASLLAHNRAVLGQALARSGQMDRGIAELEVACPEILENQQNAHGRRDSNKSWLRCYENLAEMYKAQERFEDADSLLNRMPWLSNAPAQEVGVPSSPEGDASADGSSPADTVPTANEIPPGVVRGSSVEGINDTYVEMAGKGGGRVEEDLEAATYAESGDVVLLEASDVGEPQSTDSELSPSRGGDGRVEELSRDVPPKVPSPSVEEGGSSDASSKSGGGRAESSSVRGAGAARVAGLSKAAAAEAVAKAGAAEAETESEAAAARALVDRHAEAMRSSLNEIVGELAVTTATRPTASQEWLDSRVVAAEEILASVRAGLLAGEPSAPEQESLGDRAGGGASFLPVGTPGHADVLREASHYLSAIKGVAAQGWTYVDNELHRMERHPAQAAKPGFQSRREVIHTFRYLLIKARQYASENQNQGMSGGGSSQAARSRRKDRGRKSSATSKASRKGSTARKSSSRSEAGSSSSKDSDGFLTLFLTAGFALLVAAFSQGRGGGGQSRRRDGVRQRTVVRQRTATRAVKTISRYIQLPQRAAIIAFMLQAWSCIKRAFTAVTAHATNTVVLARALFLSSCAAVGERLTKANDASVSMFGSRTSAAVGSAARAEGAENKKKSSAQYGHPSGKQRSKKHSRKSPPAPVPFAHQLTAVLTPPASPRASVKPTAGNKALQEGSSISLVQENAFAMKTGDETGAIAAVTEMLVAKEQGVYPAGSVAKVTSSRPTSGIADHDKRAVGNSRLKQASPPRDDDKKERSEGEGEVGDRGDKEDTPVTHAGPVPSTTVDPLSPTKPTAAVEITAGVTFPGVMTVEQVRAMVEEDERAWEQARSSERQRDRAEVAHASRGELPNGGWSEVGGGGAGASRARTGGGGRGKVLSMQNVHAASRGASQAPRPCSPGSDPATTTSAASSDGSEGSSDKPIPHLQIQNHHPAREVKGGRVIVTGRLGNRASTGTNRRAIPRASGGAGEKVRGLQTSRGGVRGDGGRGRGGSIPSASSQIRSARQQPARGAQSRALSTNFDAASSRAVRRSHAPWATARANSTPQLAHAPGGGGSNQRSCPGPQLGRASSGSEQTRLLKPSPWKVATHSEQSSHKDVQHPIPSVTCPMDVVAKEKSQSKVAVAVVKSQSKVAVAVVNGNDWVVKPDTEGAGEKWGKEAAAEVAAPEAWTSTTLNPPRTKPDTHALPPASEPPRPPPQHQQYWQRQQMRLQQEKQKLEQQQKHFYHHHQEQQMVAMSANASVQQQQQLQHVAGHHFPTPSLPPHHHQYEHQYQHQSQHEMIMPQYPPPSDDTFPPSSSSINAAVGTAGLTIMPTPMIYPPHTPIHVPSPSSALSPRGDGNEGAAVGDMPYHFREGSYDSTGVGSNAVADSVGFSTDATILVPPPPMVIMPPQQRQQSPVSDGADGGASSMYGGNPLAGYAPTNGGDEAVEALIGTLCWQVEYYFSEENLVKDAYLRGLMDDDGYVAVSKIMVFNRVRGMTSDMSIVLEAMRRSSELDLLEQDRFGEARVRTRHDPLRWTHKQSPNVDGPPALPLEPELVRHQAEHVCFDGEAGLPEASVTRDQGQQIINA